MLCLLPTTLLEQPIKDLCTHLEHHLKGCLPHGYEYMSTHTGLDRENGIRAMETAILSPEGENWKWFEPMISVVQGGSEGWRITLGCLRTRQSRTYGHEREAQFHTFGSVKVLTSEDSAWKTARVLQTEMTNIFVHKEASCMALNHQFHAKATRGQTWAPGSPVTLRLNPEGEYISSAEVLFGEKSIAKLDRVEKRGRVVLIAWLIDWLIMMDRHDVPFEHLNIDPALKQEMVDVFGFQLQKYFPEINTFLKKPVTIAA